MLGFNSSEDLTNFTNHDISDYNMRCEVCIKEIWNDMSRNSDLLKKVHSLVKALNKNYISPREGKYGVCKTFKTRLTKYFFTVIGLGTASFENEPLFTQQKKNPLIACIGPMYIDFDEYPRYSSRKS